MNGARSEDHLFGSFVIFAALLLISSTLLLIALLLWLAQQLGSLILAMLIVGGVSAVVSLLIYFCRIRPLLLRLRDEVRAIYEAISVVRASCDWISKRLTLFLALFR